MVALQTLNTFTQNTGELTPKPLWEEMSESPFYAERAAAQIIAKRLESRENWAIAPGHLHKQQDYYQSSLSALHKLMNNEDISEDEKKLARGLYAEVCIYTLFGDLDNYDISITPGSVYSDINGVDFVISVGNVRFQIDVTTSDWNELAEKYAQKHAVAIFPMYNNGDNETSVPDNEKKGTFIEYANIQWPLARNVFSAQARVEILVELAEYNVAVAGRHVNNRNWEVGADKSMEFWESVRSKLRRATVNSEYSI